MPIPSQTDDAVHSQVCPDPPGGGRSSQFESEDLCSTTQVSAYLSRLSGPNNHQSNRNTEISSHTVMLETLNLSEFRETDIETQPTQEIDRTFVERIAAEKFKIGKLKDEQWDIVHSIVIKRQDTILNAATGFGKSLTFQILPFVQLVNQPPAIVLILMPLKLLQSDQAKKINEIPGGKSCVIQGDSDRKKRYREIVHGLYTHIFTSPEFAMDPDFRREVLSHPDFRRRLMCVAIDEFHLTIEWQHFRPQFGKLSGFRQLIPKRVPFLGVSATLPQRLLDKIIPSVGIRSSYWLKRVKLDRSELYPMIRPMEKSARSFLDLSALLAKDSTNPSTIPKTIVFMDKIPYIRAAVAEIQRWMKFLKFPRYAVDCVRPYFASMAERDKAEIAKEFAKPDYGNDRSMWSTIRIIIATDAYGMGIDNPDIKRIVLWHPPRTIESYSQRCGRAGRDGKCQAETILLYPKYCLEPPVPKTLSNPKIARNPALTRLNPSHQTHIRNRSNSGGESDGNPTDSAAEERDNVPKRKRITNAEKFQALDPYLRDMINSKGKCQRRIVMVSQDDAGLAELKYQGDGPCPGGCDACDKNARSWTLHEGIVKAHSKTSKFPLLEMAVRVELEDWRQRKVATLSNNLAINYPELFLSNDGMDEIVNAIVYNKNARENLKMFQNECSSWKHAESDEYHSDFVAIWHKVNMEHNPLYKERLEALKKTKKRHSENPKMTAHEKERQQLQVRLARYKSSTKKPHGINIRNQHNQGVSQGESPSLPLAAAVQGTLSTRQTHTASSSGNCAVDSTILRPESIPITPTQQCVLGREIESEENQQKQRSCPPKSSNKRVRNRSGARSPLGERDPNIQSPTISREGRTIKRPRKLEKNM